MTGERRDWLLEMLLVHLSRREFKLIYGLVFLADGSEFEDAIDLSSYGSPGHEEVANQWPEWIRKCIRYLWFEHGYDFEFLAVHDNGSIHRRGDLFEPRNISYLELLRNNQVDRRDAMRIVMEEIDRGRLSLPIELMREVFTSMDEAIGFQEAHVDHEKLERFDALRDMFLASEGIVRKEKVH